LQTILTVAIRSDGRLNPERFLYRSVRLAGSVDLAIPWWLSTLSIGPLMKKLPCSGPRTPPTAGTPVKKMRQAQAKSDPATHIRRQKPVRRIVTGN
jgi:hypothetical protein